MPNVKIVPVLLHGNLGLEKSIELGDKIFEAIKDKKCFVLASMDFSHYLSPERADEMDEITIKAIKERNFEALAKMGNDNLDSPPSIISLLEIMNRANKVNMKVVDHSNSSRIVGKHSDSTTSYFTLGFY